MATQEGFEYEKNAYKELKKYNISTGVLAGASSDKPDLTIQIPKTSKKAGCELKTTTASGGSLVLKYYNGEWTFGDTEGKEEKEFLLKVGKKINLLKEMNNGKWNGKVPHLQNDPQNPRKKIIVGAKNKIEAHKKDLEQFGAKNEIKIKVNGKVICDYYIIKKCSYLNVGTHGFYTLNNKDDLGLNPKLKKMKYTPIPNFATTVNLIMRVRAQYKGGGDYQFVMNLDFTSVKKSEYNIAPIRKGSKSVVDAKELQSNLILKAFM
jgi:hypothetical protein